MKKKMIRRGLLGFPLGIAIGYVITIGLSLAFADGFYSPCVPDLILAVGNEILAVILQAFLCGLLGSAFGAASLIWEVEAWSILKQTGIYFLVISAVMIPVAYCACWMEHSIKGFLSYSAIFTVIFVTVWLAQWIAGRNNIRKINETLHKTK